MRKFIIYAACFLMLMGCASSEVHNISGSSNVHLDPKMSVYIAVPSDPSSDYPGTGQYVATVLAGKFADHGVQVTIANGPATIEANLDAARKQGAGYMIISVVSNWEHNATQWSFNPSIMALRLSIVNVSTGAQIKVDNIEDRSSHISFFGTDPKELLADALDDYVGNLYK
jgi:hypothetical protein